MLIEKAFLSRFLALAFSYPSKESLGELKGALGDLALVLRTLGFNFSVEDLAREISAVESRLMDVQGEYTSLFETEMKAPARETSYELDKMARRSLEMSDLEGFYRAFGLQLKAPLEPDSLVAELEFLSYLYQKEHFLKEKGDQEGVSVVADARVKFLRDHLGRWYEIFVQKVKEATEEKFYLLMADLLKLFLDKETEEIKDILKLTQYKKETLEGSTWKCGFM